MPEKESYVVVDADAHVVETERTWDYLDGSDKKFRPQLYTSRGDPTRQYWVLDGRIRGVCLRALGDDELDAMSKKSDRELKTPQAARELRDVKVRLEHMNKLGVDIQVMHNTVWLEQVTEREDAEIALSMSWNCWMADVWKQGEGRLWWSCVVPARSVSEALQQIRFAKQNGSVAVCLKPFEAGRHLVDPYFYPIYEEAARLDMAIAVHIANGDPQLCELFRARYDRGGGFAVFRIPTVMTCFSLLMSEIPYVFPHLRWGFIESSAQWVPWVVNESIRRSAGSQRKYPENPLHAFKVYVSAQTDDDFPFVIKYSGEERIVIGTDYGHTDASSEVDAVTVFKTNAAVSHEQKRKILSDNPKALYAL